MIRYQPISFNHTDNKNKCNTTNHLNRSPYTIKITKILCNENIHVVNDKQIINIRIATMSEIEDINKQYEILKCNQNSVLFKEIHTNLENAKHFYEIYVNLQWFNTYCSPETQHHIYSIADHYYTLINFVDEPDLDNKVFTNTTSSVLHDTNMSNSTV